MGLIVRNLKVKGDRGEKIINCLFDTGASLSLIRKDIVKDIATPLMIRKSIKFKLGDGKGEIEAKEITPLCFEIDGDEIYDDAMIVEELGEELIIGAGTLQKWRIKLDLEHDEIILDKRALRLRL